MKEQNFALSNCPVQSSTGNKPTVPIISSFSIMKQVSKNHCPFFYCIGWENTWNELFPFDWPLVCSLIFRLRIERKNNQLLRTYILWIFRTYCWVYYRAMWQLRVLWIIMEETAASATTYEIYSNKCHLSEIPVQENQIQNIV